MCVFASKREAIMEGPIDKAIEKEQGAKLPAGAKVDNKDEISDADIETVAGGATTGTHTCLTIHVP